MDELDLTAAGSKIIYEHMGWKVNSLYMAEIKEKCETIERINYNLPKSVNSK